MSGLKSEFEDLWIDSPQVRVEPNFLVSCVDNLARQRWEEMSGISLVTRVGQSP